MKLTPVILGFFIMSMYSFSQNSSQYKEYTSDYLTYTYSDANPIPVFGKIYPYFRYDGYTTMPEKKSWKVVELENDFLTIIIFPEIGGKIWSVIDKRSGKEMFYGNKVVKFRDISLRGPWTSGGIEFNYGVIGHSSSCSFPVDYLVRNNKDGSVSCIIGMLDLLTRTYWSVEINLPKDRGWFTTKSFWHNRSGYSQPYYNWVNTAITAKDDLMLIYPGTHNIGHDGMLISSWPVDSIQNKDISIWAENNFESDRSKSYHIFGSHDSYFGAYWKSDDFGWLHYADREERLGKKMFSWALSDLGKIWEELLTDQNGQYVELQSGRLFNQNMVSSSLTPFKQILFQPYQTDVWTEYWFPIEKIKGVKNVSLVGAINVEKNRNSYDISIYPLQTCEDTLTLYDGDGQVIKKEYAKLDIQQLFPLNIPVSENEELTKIFYGHRLLWQKEDNMLSRPVKTIDNFDWDTSYGHYLKGRDLMGFRLYDQAEPHIKESLRLNPNYIPSLVELARLYFYQMKYDSAFSVAKKALSIDTYDVAANYEYGCAALRLGKYFDALDGFEVASLSESYRSASYTKISEIYLAQKDFEKSLEYAQKSLVNNQNNIQGLQLSYLSYTLTGENKKAEAAGNRISELDPLNHFARFENYLKCGDTQALAEFKDGIRNGMPEQTYLELGTWYHQMNLPDRSLKILEQSPETPVVCYWKAFLNDILHMEVEKTINLQKALEGELTFQFPFREESKTVFEWAIKEQSHWRPRYLLALLYKARNRDNEAYNLLSSLHEDVNFAPFYSFFAQLESDHAAKENYLKEAVSLAPAKWQYISDLTRYYLANNENIKALETIAPFYRNSPEQYQIGLLYTRALINNKKYVAAENILSDIIVLPAEGYRDGHKLYRQTKLMLAAEELLKNNLAEAQQKIDEARQYPRNLGVGKPNDDDIDFRLEDWLNAMIAQKSGEIAERNKYLKKVAFSNKYDISVNCLLQILAFYQLEEKQLAEEMLNDWLSKQINPDIKAWGTAFYNTHIDKPYLLSYKYIADIIESITHSEFTRMF